MRLFRLIKDKAFELFWSLKFLQEDQKMKIYNFVLKILGRNKAEKIAGDENSNRHINNLLRSQFLDNSFSVDYPRLEQKLNLEKNDVKLLAYYLPQYCPNKYNDGWWGKGSTEWTNVGKSMPQYINHYQPRYPGELGYYDLRLSENIRRQVELAKIFGVYGFCFYYYWFDGVKLLDDVIDRFVNDTEISFPFSICWCNESWTQQWNSSSQTPIMKISETEESYKEFIKSCIYLFNHKNYIRINNKIMLSIYKPNNIPNISNVIEYWRGFVRTNLKCDLYLIGIVENSNENDLLNKGFDAISEFYPVSGFRNINDITDKKVFACEEFLGKVFDYKNFVINKKYFNNVAAIKYHRAICPMWDNTARKKNKAIVFDGATPDLYKQWLKDIIIETKQRVEKKELDDNLIFINAWNEWAEGAYLEPDLYWKYGYLEATRDAILETRE